ncbi:MAG: hypothetical protein H5T86_15460 [Armatimonadetes bacterium]|nr:hypothetical protein [Armatimonadota bacterium]
MAQTGSVQYALWSPDGWTTVYSVGKVVGGQRGLDANVSTRRSIGGQGTIVGGVMVPRLIFSYLPETAALLTYVKRAAYPAGPLPELSFEAGTGAEGVRLTAAKCNRCVVDLAVGEALRVEMDWWSPARPVPTAGGWMAPIGAPTFEWYGGAVTVDGASYAAQRAKITLENNLMAVATLDTKPAGHRRYPDEILEGYEEVAAVVDFLADPGYDLGGDELPRADVRLQATNGTETVTILLENAVPERWRQGFEIDGLIAWRVEYRLPPNSGLFSITVT